ncbi:Gfo/Idh/MocA family protein [Empedobacter sedimenti]|uniref:Gfo/Idh/MocA family protein n=1 Tax=Empedobacter sedimenti TaxID=3042610 RepID=UPI0024A7863E|nr:Gfo/Idh/MocA family oxidoreductase [Empedobacter sedimenti]
MKVLIIGLGSIAQKHIAALRQIDSNVSIFALRSNKNSEEFDGVHNIYDLQDFDVKGVDFILISNPTAQHFSTIKDLIQFSKPLFIEKPLFSEITKNSQDLVLEIEQKNIPTYIACNLRFLDSLTELKNMITNKIINEVNAYCGSYLPNWRTGVDFRKVYSANKEMGGGVHIDLIHELDYVYWLFGEPKQTRSYFSNDSSLDISAFDYANYLWKYDTFAASIVLNYYRKDSKRSIEILTSDNTYYVNLLKNEIYKNNNLIFSSEQRIVDTYYNQMKFFIDEVLGNNGKFNTIAEANKILELCMQD